MNTSQHKSARNSAEQTNQQAINGKTVIPAPRPGMTTLERSLIGNINQCDKLTVAYQQAQGGVK